MNENTVVLQNGNVLDMATGNYAQADVVWSEGRIVEVAKNATVPASAKTIDAAGGFVIPGLIDAHVHVTAMTADLASPSSEAASYVAIKATEAMAATLDRGFTTVRDASGADFGLARAQEEGLFRGPRLMYCGKALSQTGGHADFRAPGEHVSHDLGNCCAGIGRVVDGVDAVRKAARDELRKGAHHIKIMASGGVASPTDRIDSTQFSIDEIEAVVQEATAANRYVAAHAYTARAINRALRAGVRSIEHGNLLDEESIALFKEHDAFLVPTLVTYWALKEEGKQFGLSEANWDKVDAVLDAGLAALETAHKAGVKIAFATDLLGKMQRHQNQEFSIRAQVQDNLSILRSATTVAAELIEREGELGVIAPGAHADLLVLDADPLTNIEAVSKIANHKRYVIQGGVVVS
jgi:imidazolonepropionase-like amidohydrolase